MPSRNAHIHIQTHKSSVIFFYLPPGSVCIILFFVFCFEIGLVVGILLKGRVKENVRRIFKNLICGQLSFLYLVANICWLFTMCQTPDSQLCKERFLFLLLFYFLILFYFYFYFHFGELSSQRGQTVSIFIHLVSGKAGTQIHLCLTTEFKCLNTNRNQIRISLQDYLLLERNSLKPKPNVIFFITYLLGYGSCSVIMLSLSPYFFQYNFYWTVFPIYFHLWF